MGGLVGWAEDSTIEYSRVRSNYVGESNELQESVVRNDYDITVGALGGKSVYAGGIVGGVNTADGETRIVDCFCTADVSFMRQTMSQSVRELRDMQAVSQVHLGEIPTLSDVIMPEIFIPNSTMPSL